MSDQGSEYQHSPLGSSIRYISISSIISARKGRRDAATEVRVTIWCGYVGTRQSKHAQRGYVPRHCTPSVQHAAADADGGGCVGSAVRVVLEVELRPPNRSHKRRCCWEPRVHLGVQQAHTVGPACARYVYDCRSTQSICQSLNATNVFFETARTRHTHSANKHAPVNSKQHVRVIELISVNCSFHWPWQPLSPDEASMVIPNNPIFCNSKFVLFT